MKLTFLSAGIPLVKSFTRAKDGAVSKSDYPLVKNFTSHTAEATTLRQLFDVLVEQSTSKLGPCLLKGELIRPLENESRAKMCEPGTKTQLLMFDLDKAPFTSPAEFMKAVQLDDVSYIWQWSSSAKMDTKQKSISGHIFVMLSKPMHPQLIKAWLMHINLHTEVLRRHITLSSGKQALHWPLDIVVNDNGRIIYIGTPKFINVADPIPPKERIQFVKRTNDLLDIAKVPQHHIEALKKTQRELLNELRKKEGIEPIKAKTTIVGDFEVQKGVGEATGFEVYDCGDYVRLNLNGGDSKAYWHPKNNAEYIHSFKGEPSMLTKEILPGYYKSLKGERADETQTLSQEGDLVLCFREKRTAEYWKGLFNEADHTLEIHKVKSKDQLIDYYLSHQVAPPEFIQEMEIIFDPSTDKLVDFDQRTVNKFVLPAALRTQHKPGKYPLIQRIIDSAVGTGPIQEHFLNWLACIFQYRCKTGTAWILHGTQGTGKGLIVERILMSIFGGYVGHINASSLKGDFMSFHEHRLITFIDEIEVDMFEEKSVVESKLKNMIVDVNDKIHRKGVDEYSVPSFHNMIFGSNKDQPVSIPRDDRRFNVAKYQPNPLRITLEEIEKVLPRETPAFINYMMTRKADRTIARQILQTDDRAAVQALSITSVDEFAQDITGGNLEKLFEYMPDEKALQEHAIVNPAASAYAYLLKRFITEDESKISRDELFLMFQHAIGKVPEGQNKFTSFLRHHGIHTRRLRTEDAGLTYGIDVKWRIDEKVRKELSRALPERKDKIRRVK